MGIRRASLAVEAYCQEIEERVTNCERLWNALQGPQDTPTLGNPPGE
jgi:hypothetical protein